MAEWDGRCRCCGRFIFDKGAMFCRDCEGHRSWCVKQEPQEKGVWDQELRRWVKRPASKRGVMEE